MDTILKYLEMSFSSLPNTEDVFRLKEEMAANMEDKYRELKSQGKSENEAIGIVIAEFGNIEEIAEELNLNMKYEEDSYEDLVAVNMDQVYEYVDINKINAKLVGAGVFVIFLGVAILIAMSLFDGVSGIYSTVGVVTLLIFVAFAVGIFIYADSLLASWTYIGKGDFYMDVFVRDKVKTMEEDYRPTTTSSTIIAVVLYILCPVMIILASVFGKAFGLEDSLSTMSVSLVLLIVAFATNILIRSNGPAEAYKKLLKKENGETKKTNSIINAIASIWWPVTTVIFLVWSFLGIRGWTISWVVWPISGILFSGIAGFISAMEKKEE